MMELFAGAIGTSKIRQATGRSTMETQLKQARL